DGRLLQVPGPAKIRRDDVQILACALRAVDAYAVTARALRRQGNTLLVNTRAILLPAGARVIVVGAGKACAPMARVVEDVLGDRITSGLVVVKTGYTAPLRQIALREATHPLPGPAGEAAAAEILEMG